MSPVIGVFVSILFSISMIATVKNILNIENYNVREKHKFLARNRNGLALDILLRCGLVRSRLSPIGLLKTCLRQPTVSGEKVADL